jgi:hypothetical protein
MCSECDINSATTSHHKEKLSVQRNAKSNRAHQNGFQIAEPVYNFDKTYCRR